jgi:CAAX protease family protein
MGPALLAAGLVVYNSAANRWAPFRGWAYVPMNVAVTAAVVAIGAGPLGLGAAGMGFGAGWGTDALLGLAVGAALAIPVLTAAFLPSTRRFAFDERVRGLEGATLIYRLLVRVPVGTALLEETAFRGVLYGAWRSHGTVAAAVGSAIAFGLWHVSPTINLVQANRPGSSVRRTTVAVLAAVFVTGLAGLGFAALRASTGTLGVPLGLHASLNSFATFAAVLATRRLIPKST